MPTSISPEVLLKAADLLGRASAYEAGPADAIDGVRPRVVVEPDSPEAVASALAWASRERMAVVLRGNGTKLGWGRRPSSIDLIVTTRRLNQVTAHQHGDLTATVQAGATVRTLNQELARRGQWLPIDVTFNDATVGGTIAVNDSGPLRHRHGTLRDLLIGVRLAMTDGRVVKAGSNVVKNVAGYDLGKLMSGSFGTLAAIVSATFKLAPLPASSATLVASYGEPEGLARAVAAVASSQLEPVALDVHVTAGRRSAGLTGVNGAASSYELLVQFASTREVVDLQIEDVARLLAADRSEVVRDADEADRWREHRERESMRPGAVIKMSWLPASLLSVMSLLQEIARSGANSVGLVGRAGVGSGIVRVDADLTTQVKAIERLRASAVVGHVVVVRADPDVKTRADVWGPSGDAAAILRAVKRAFDPAGILNADRGPV